VLLCKCLRRLQNKNYTVCSKSWFVPLNMPPEKLSATRIGNKKHKNRSSWTTVSLLPVLMITEMVTKIDVRFQCKILWKSIQWQQNFYMLTDGEEANGRFFFCNYLLQTCLWKVLTLSHLMSYGLYSWKSLALSKTLCKYNMTFRKCCFITNGIYIDLIHMFYTNNNIILI
jgi:hypothetical protein